MEIGGKSPKRRWDCYLPGPVGGWWGWAFEEDGVSGVGGSAARGPAGPQFKDPWAPAVALLFVGGIDAYEEVAGALLLVETAVATAPEGDCVM